VLALATQKASTMVGVFISVTTVPAAGNLALGLAVWQRTEILGSLEQLVLNIFGMIVAGTLFLLLQRRIWVRVTHVAERPSGVRGEASH
jgi:hypothetical protein